MSQEMAEEEFGRYERCTSEICGYDEDRNPMYCFRPLEGPSPEEPRCPDGCVCMSQEMAEEEFGRYERCTSEICGYDEDRNPMYCFRPLEGPYPAQPLDRPDLTIDLYGYEIQTAPGQKGIFPWPPLADRPTIFQVQVKNAGTAPIEDKFGIGLYVDDNPECNWTFAPIAEEEDPLHQYNPLMPGGTRIYNCEGTFPEGEHSLRWVVDTGNEVGESNESNNLLITTARWQAPPDLIVENIFPTAEPAGGQPSTWIVDIRNIGQGDVSVPFITTFWPEGIAGGSQENFWVQSLPAGKSTSFNTSQSFRSWGKLNITVTTDASYSVTEALPGGEDNNQLIRQFDLAYVDLAVNNLTAKPEKLIQDGNATISFTVKNIGTADALQPFKVKLFPGKVSTAMTQPVLLTVTELKAGESIDLKQSVKLMAGDYQVSVEVDHPDPNIVYFEPDRQNNVAVKPIHVYSSGEVFLVSDMDWKQVLKLVSLSTWRDKSCAGGVCKYPTLIFHMENDDAFDADAIIRFLQQYDPNRVTVFGNTSATQIPVFPIPGINPQTLESLLVASKSAGAGLQATQIAKYDPDSYLYFWADINNVVLSEEDYETGLMASVLASYLNAPLVFDDQELGPSIFDHRVIYTVGKINESITQEISNRSTQIREKTDYSLEELQKAYAGWTGTDKAILVNPADLSIGADKDFKPDKSPEIHTIYTGHSLAAPFLAAAKFEVIISTTANTYLGVDSYVETTLDKLKLKGSPTYLTIVANPRAIPMARENRDTFPALWGDNVVLEEIDPENIDSRALKLELITFDASTKTVGSHNITGTDANPTNPAIYEDAVVWQDYRNGNPEIYMYNLSTQSETRITNNASHQTYPAIFGDKIVWQDNRNSYNFTNKDGKVEKRSHWDIYMYDLSQQKEIRITMDIHDQVNPAIYGDRIVWQDKRNGNQWDIYMYDIPTKTETRITSNPHEQMNPAIHGDRIVWQDKRNGNQWDIYTYNIAGGNESQESQITTNPSDQVYPSISGNRIVWEDRRQGSSHIFVYDLSTRTETQMTTGDNKQIRPLINGDHVIWYSEGKTGVAPVHVAPPAGSQGGEWLTYFHDLSTGKTLWYHNLLTHVFSNFRQEVDGRYYGSLINYEKQDRAVGRIFGVTTSDVSSYIARDLFFDDIKPSDKKALLIVREDHQPETRWHETYGPSLYDYAVNNYWTGDVPTEFDTVYFYAGGDTGAEQAPAVNKNIPQIRGLYDDCYLILYADHGGWSGFDTVVTSEVLRTNEVTLLPSIVLDIACATCTPLWGYDPEWGPYSDKGVTFCMENIRRGAMVYMGAVDLSYWHRMFDNILKGAFVDGKTIGEVYLEARNEEYNSCASSNPPWPCGDTYYALIGDPTFKPRWW
jgi:beta propeller repeat protein